MTSSGRIIGVGVILASTIFEAIGQLAFKKAADNRPTASSGPIAAVMANSRWVLLGFLSFIIEGLLWSAALYYLDVSVAHPIGSLVFVVVAIVSRIVLRERITPIRCAGIALILCGSVLVAFN